MDLPIGSPHSAGSDEVTRFYICELAILYPEDFRIAAQCDRLTLAIRACHSQRSAVELLYCSRDPGLRAIWRALGNHRFSRKSEQCRQSPVVSFFMSLH